MAKVNPVMKNVKPTRTAEQVAIEEFIDSIPPVLETVNNVVVVDNTIPETLVEEDHSLDPIIESVTVADTLDGIATDVDASTTAIAMESYRRLFAQITSMSGHPIQSGVSLESFPVTKGGKKQLAKAIRSHAKTIRECVQVALEDYVDQVDQKIESSMSNYKQALGELNRVDENSIDIDGNVSVNHKVVWRLFHRNGKLMDLRDFHDEVESIKKLADLVSKSKDVVSKWQTGENMSGTVLTDTVKVDLMNNTRVTVTDGRSQWNELDTPKPDKSWSAGDWFWIFMFSWMGLVYRLIRGGNGAEKTQKKQSLKAISKVVGEMKRMAPLVQGIENDAKAIIAMVEHAPEDQIADVKRAVSPVLELASKTVSHVTQVTYGAMKMFRAAENG